MATKKLTLAERARKDPELLKRVLANPGLRSKLPASMLPPELRAARAQNIRLAQPIVPGSSITERALGQEAKAAGNVRYGDVERSNERALGEEVQRGIDLGNWWDQYLAAVAKHSQNVNTIGQQAGQLGQNLQAGITGLGQAGLAQIQNPANADAAARGVTTAGNLAPLENQALAVRQALVGSFVASEAAKNAASQTYADTLANVVAPGQKLGAVAQQAGKVKQARQDITDTAKQRGDWETTYRADRRSDEAKNVLAQATLTGKTEQAKADAKDKAATRFGPGSNVTNKYGFTYDEWNKLSEKDRNNWRSGKNTRAPAKPKDEQFYTDGPFMGKSYTEVRNATPEQRKQWTDEYNARQDKPKDEKPKAPQAQYEEDFFKKYGVKPVTTDQSNRAKKDIGAIGPKLRALIKGVKPDGSPLTTKKGKKVGKLTPDKAGQMLSGSYDATLVRVAMDLIKYKGFITAATADRLHHSGYSVRQLGLKTLPNTSTPKNPPKPPTFNPAGNLGGLPKP